MGYRRFDKLLRPFGTYNLSLGRCRKCHSAPSSVHLAGNAVMPASDSETVVCSWTEWQPLEEIIVGRCEESCIPGNDPAYEAKLGGQHHKLFHIKGKRSEAAIKIGQEELQGYCEVLESNG